RIPGGFPTWGRGAGEGVFADEARRVRLVTCATAACAPSDAAMLHVIDFHDASPPSSAGSIVVAPSGGAPVTKLSADLAFVASLTSIAGASGETTDLRVVRTEPSPRVVGSVKLEGRVTSLALQGDRLFALGTLRGSRLAIHEVDLRAPSAPRVRGPALFGADFSWSPAEDDALALSFDPSSSRIALPISSWNAVEQRLEHGAQIVDIGD